MNDTDKTRRLLKLSLLPALALAGAALWLMLPFGLTHFSIGAYDAGNYKTAQDWLQPLSVANAFERYKLHYNRGTAAAMNKQYDVAVTELTTALTYAENTVDSCRVRTNLVMTYKKQGGTLLAAQQYEPAITAYLNAIGFVTDEPKCFESKTVQELSDAAEKAKELSGTKSDGTDDQAGSSTSTTPSSSQTQQLNQAEHDSAKSKQEDNELSKKRDLSDYENTVDKPW